MQTFTYDIYYRFDGPTLADPLAEELDDEQAVRNIETFFDEVASHFTDTEAKFERCDHNRLKIITDLPRKVFDERMKECLSNLHLCARKGFAK